MGGQKDAADPKAGLRGIQTAGKPMMSGGKLEKADQICQENNAVSQSAQHQYMTAPLGKQGIEVEYSSQDKEGSQKMDAPQSLGCAGMKPGK